MWHTTGVTNTLTVAQQPSYVRAYEQWDANVTYEVIDGLMLFVEGINVTNNTFRSFARSPYQVYGVGKVERATTLDSAIRSKRRCS